MVATPSPQVPASGNPPHLRRSGFPGGLTVSSGEAKKYAAALGLKLSADDFTDTEAIAAVHRITSGNFRLVQRLFTQIARVLEISGLSVISREVVETARESLVIGTL